MSNFVLKINGLNELISDAEQAGLLIQPALLKTMTTATTMIQEDAKRIGPGSFKNRTGNLRRSISRVVESAYRGLVSVGEKYGAYVEFGTRPHTITPKKGKMLAFRVNGQLVFARKVNHPGSKPYPYMGPAFENNAPKIIDLYAKIAQSVVNKLGGKFIYE